MRMTRFLVLAMLTAILVGSCQSTDISTADSLSSEEVLATAQARAEATRQATFQTPPPTPITPSPTAPLITDTPVPSVTPTPARPIATADYNAYVRTGPDESYSDIDFLFQGQQGYIIGRYENDVTGTWWYIERIGEGKDGWIWSGAVTTSGDVLGVQLLEAPPLDD
jgi:hypothetical protein